MGIYEKYFKKIKIFDNKIKYKIFIYGLKIKIFHKFIV
jgi:hypothetical protein